jgi:hypothetical protein
VLLCLEGFAPLATLSRGYGRNGLGTLKVEAADKKTAEAKVDEACKKLLANQIMEKYAFTLEEA